MREKKILLFLIFGVSALIFLVQNQLTNIEISRKIYHWVENHELKKIFKARQSDWAKDFLDPMQDTNNGLMKVSENDKHVDNDFIKYDGKERIPTVFTRTIQTFSNDIMSTQRKETLKTYRNNLERDKSDEVEPATIETSIKNFHKISRIKDLITKQNISTHIPSYDAKYVDSKESAAITTTKTATVLLSTTTTAAEIITTNPTPSYKEITTGLVDARINNITIRNTSTFETKENGTNNNPSAPVTILKNNDSIKSNTNISQEEMVLTPENNNENSTNQNKTFLYGESSTENKKESIANILYPTKARLLLLYTSVFGNPQWRDTPVTYNFTEMDQITPCAVNHCRITYDKMDINKSDAVLFHGRDLPPPDELKRLRKRINNTDQIWIWVMHESPLYTYYDPQTYNGIFNWTSTYRPSSDVFIPYFSYRNLRESEEKPALGTNFALGKDKVVLFINSHCDPTRMEFIKKLKKYINVDVYGRCKNQMNPELEDCPRNSKKCKHLQQRYKFYLALENSYCDDYVTEKYFKNSLQRHLVPIVMGKANYSDSRIAIPDSYIHIEDFKNITQLADYIKYLDRNDKAYNRYLQWTYTYKVELQHGMCKFCKALWEKSTLIRKEIDLGRLWGAELTCKNETVFF